MQQISLPSNWISAYEPIEYVFKKKIPLLVDNSANYLGLVASTDQPLYYRLDSFGVGSVLCEIGDRINLTYENTVIIGAPLYDHNFVVIAIDTGGNPILDALVGSLTLPPGTVDYAPFARIYKRSSQTFKLYAGFPSWHPKYAVRDIDTLVATIVLPADLNYEYHVRVDPFLQGLLSNPVPYIGDDDKMYIGFKLKSVGNFTVQEGAVYYCLNGTKEDLNTSTFVTTPVQLTDYQAVKFNAHSCLVSKIIDDSVFNKLL